MTQMIIEIIGVFFFWWISSVLSITIAKITNQDVDPLQIIAVMGIVVLLYVVIVKLC